MDHIKKLVSRNKRRYKDDEFDLDLTYIYPNIIAMGFPAEKLEGVYRNHIDDVVRFLDTKHKDHYRVYNLCTERKYDSSKFHNRVVSFAFEDHNPPSIELIEPFCEDLDVWLCADSKNIAAIHCKAGKGRTGVMICAYLLHRKRFTDPMKCLEYYGQTRTRDGKGVTIPSQRRYVEYYGSLISRQERYHKKVLLLSLVRFSSVPNINSGTCNIFFEVSSSSVRLGTSPVFEITHKQGCVEMDLRNPIVVAGDICVDFFHKTPRIGAKEKIFQCWFNTFFIKETEVTKKTVDNRFMCKYLKVSMSKSELDKANKDKTNKIYKKDFKVEFFFQLPMEMAHVNICMPNKLSVKNGAHKPHVVRQSDQSTLTEELASQLQPGTMSLKPITFSESCQLPEIKPLESDDKSSQCHGYVDGKHKNSKEMENTAKLRIPHAVSDSSLMALDKVSINSSESDNFSDTDTDDEWKMCDVTAV